MELSPDHQFTPEQEVLLWAIRVDHTKDQRVAELLTAGVDWDYVRETAIQHGIIPLLYKRLKGEMAYVVPPDELSMLRTLFLAIAIRNLQMTQHLLKVINLLADSGVEAMPFKGPVLAVQAYGDLSMRSFGDLDILIHANDISRANQILTDQGYILNESRDDNAGLILRVLEEKDLLYTFHEDIIELHWKIIERLYAVSLDTDEVWDRSLPFFINGQKVKTISPEDMVMVLCFHGFKHRWQNLSWSADLINMILNHPDLRWSDVFNRVEHIGLKRIVLIGLFLAHTHGGVRCGSETENLFITDTTMLKLAREIQLNLFQVRTSNPIEPFIYLKSRERFKDQIMFLFNYFSLLVPKVPKFLRWALRQLMG